MSRAAVVLAALVAAAPAADPPADALRRAEELAAADRPGDAEPLFREATRGGDPFTRRQAYLRLVGLYLRSGRPDKGVKLVDEFRAWLREVGDGPGEADLDVLAGECYAALGHHDQADRHFAAAVRDGRGVSPDGRLAALRGRSEAAEQRKDTAAAKRHWADLATAARAAAADAERAADVAARVKATRYLAEALRRQGDAAGALAALDPLPALHDKLRDPVGRRDAQRQRANLIAASGRYRDAAPLFREALDLSRVHRPGRRMTAGEILAEWADAATAAGDKAAAAKLRGEAEAVFLAVLKDPTPADQFDGGTPAAFARVQLLTRSARQFRKALDLSRGPGERWSSDTLLEVRIKADRGELQVIAAAYPAARANLTRVYAEVAAADPPDLRTLPGVLVSLAAAEMAGDRPDRAGPLLTRCAELYATYKLPADPVLAECDYLTGAAAMQRGEFAATVGHFRRAVATCDAAGPKAEPVRFNALLSTALLHKELGDTTGALDALKAAAASLATFAEPDDLSFGLVAAARADLHVTRAEVAPAIALVPEIEAACARHGIRGGFLWGTARHVRALDLVARNQLPQAEAVWAELVTSQRTEGQVLLARTLNHLGFSAEARKGNAEARARYEEARAFLAARPWAPAVTKALTLWRLAILYDQLGRRDDAKQLLAEVFDVADRARLGTLGEAGQRAEFFAQFRPAFELLAKWQARDGDGEALARTIARSRSRTLLDQVLAAGVDPRASLRGPLRDTLLAREAAARAAVAKLRTKVHYLPADRPDDPAVKTLFQDLEAAQQEFANAWRDIANEDPVARALADPGRDTSPLPPGLGTTTAVLAYLIGRDDSYAVLYPSPKERPVVYRLAVPKAVADAAGEPPPVTLTAVKGRRGLTIGAPPAQPERPPDPPAGPTTSLTDAVCGWLVEHYLRQVSEPGFVPVRGMYVSPRTPDRPPTPTPAAVLGDAVLPAALRDRLRATGATQVVVVPDGPLHRLPLECLVLSAADGPRYALDELPPVCSAPSLGVLAAVVARPRATGPATLLTVGDPAYPAGGLARLDYTAVESEQVRGFFPADRVTALTGAAATEGAVAAAVAGKRVVHLAAHGFADERFGNLFAAVALAPPAGAVNPEKDDDGFLSLYEIHRLPMAGCEVTVLSACVTNVGPRRPLEAGVTLAGAFLAAGSRRVVATSWPVADRATAELIAAYFAATGPANPTPAGHAAAMKVARLKVRGTPGWEAPLYWAPFVFAGAPD